MGVYREGGYSAKVEAFILCDEVRLRLAKTNGQSFYLSERSASAFPQQVEADLVIVIDGDVDSRRIVLPEGIVLGQQRVPYVDAVPF